ncbi:MAG: hypothetical protein ABGZ17_00955 [Planctomycetaceae bacterium]
MHADKHTKSTPAYRSDDVARQTDWGPLAEGGSNFASHNLQQVDSGRLEFTPTLVTRFFTCLPTVFAVLQIPVAYLLLTYGVGDQPMLKMIIKGLAVMALICGPLLSWFLVHTLLQPVVFDQSLRLFWKGRRAPDTMDDAQSSTPCCRLDDIYALQILSETVTSHSKEHGTHRYRSHELNLILQDARRLNVIDHGNLKVVRNDARQLARFLQVPVWDKTQPDGA